jgi:hypothetical protein
MVERLRQLGIEAEISSLFGATIAQLALATEESEITL